MIFLITLFFAFMYLYICIRCVSFMLLPSWLKITLLILLLPGVLEIPVVLAWGAKMPQWIINFFAGAGLALIYLTIGTFLLDLSRWIYRPITGAPEGIVFLCLVLAGYAIYNAVLLPSVHEITVHSPSLPQNWRDLKIVQLSDMHIGQGFTKERLEKIVQKTNEQQPDVIFITGDTIDQSPSTLAKDMQALAKLKAPTYMVFGNHEYYYGPKEWHQVFEKMGIPVLVNQSVVLENNAQEYVVGGADFGGWLQKNQIPARLAQTFAGTDEKLPRLLLVHYPIVFDEAVNHGILLQLSGHTHGGMTPPISWITALFNGGYVRGMYKKGKAHLYVSDGTGLWTGMPARLGSSNEIVVIHWVR